MTNHVMVIAMTHASSTSAGVVSSTNFLCVIGTIQNAESAKAYRKNTAVICEAEVGSWTRRNTVVTLQPGPKWIGAIALESPEYLSRNP